MKKNGNAGNSSSTQNALSNNFSFLEIVDLAGITKSDATADSSLSAHL